MMRFILLIALFFGIFGYAQVRPLTLDEIPDEVKKTMEISSISLVVSKQPESVGGLNELRRKFAENFNANAIKDPIKGNVSTMIYFTVETDGTVNRIKAIGTHEEFNKEAERALIATNLKFEPASVNNLPVRYLMYLPLNTIFK